MESSRLDIQLEWEFHNLTSPVTISPCASHFQFSNGNGYMYMICILMFYAYEHTFNDKLIKSIRKRAIAVIEQHNTD